MTADPQRPRLRSLREAAASICVQLALLVAFFWTPVSRYGEVHYSAADLTQSMSLTRIEPHHKAGNQLQSDAVTQMLPWVLFNRAELAAGRFPLWNPYNAAGTPHFANYQSAVLSPFSVPFYVLDFKPALLVSAALKLLALGLFTYLFLREIGCGWLAATAGALAFQFSGHNVLLLYFPHVGAMCALPAGLFFVERALRRTGDAIASGTRPRLFPSLAGLTASLVVGLFAGNPEPFYFACWGIGAWIVARLVGMLLDHRRSAPARRMLLASTGKIALALLLGAGLTAVQFLPFFEFLRASKVLEERSLRQVPLVTTWWPLLAFPDVLGNPSSIYRISDIVPTPNYELVNMSYTGAVVLLLAALAPLVAWRRRGGVFWFALAVVWFVYAHDVFGAYDLFALVPTLDMAPMNRSQGLWGFALAAAAAVALDALLRRPTRRAWFAAGWTCVAAAIAVVAFLVGADRLVDAYQHIESPFHRWFLDYVPPHVGAMTSWTLAAAAAIALLFVATHAWVRAALGALVALAVFAQTGWLLRDYNPVSPDAFVFPRTEAVDALSKQLDGERVAILGRDGLPPDSNMVYGIAQLSNYDGMWPADVDRLYRDRFGAGDNWRPVLRGSHKSLRLFGTSHVLAKWGWNFLDAGLRNFGRNWELRPQRLGLIRERPATQTFRCYEKDLSTVMVVLSTTRTTYDAVLTFRLEDVATGAIVAEQRLSTPEIKATLYDEGHVGFAGDWVLNPPGRPVVFRFPRRPESRDRVYRIHLECEGARDADTIYAWHMPVLGYGMGESFHGSRKLPGELLFDWTCGEDLRFEEVRKVDDYTLFRLRSPAPLFATVDGAIFGTSDSDAFQLVRDWAFDSKRLVVIGPDVDDRGAPDAERTRRPKRDLVQFTDSPFVYLASEDGRRLAHIDDEATFLANRLEWAWVRTLTPAERAGFEIVPDTDLPGKRAVGLHLISPAVADERPPAVLERTPIHARLRIERAHPGYLVVANTYDRGWKATLDGRDVPLLRANYAFQAIEVPAGTSEVELRYFPDSLAIGVWIGAASLLVAIGAWIASRRGATPA